MDSGKCLRRFKTLNAKADSRTFRQLFLASQRYFSRNTASWCATCPATMNAHARTVNGLPLAMPFRIQASSGRLRKNEMVARRISRNSSTCRAQGRRPNGLQPPQYPGRSWASAYRNCGQTTRHASGRHAPYHSRGPTSAGCSIFPARNDKEIFLPKCRAETEAFHRAGSAAQGEYRRWRRG